MGCANEARGILRLLLPAPREQVGNRDPQGLGQEEEFFVGDATDACLYLGQRTTADVPARPLAFPGEAVLGEALVGPDLGDLPSCDVRWQWMCSDFGT